MRLALAALLLAALSAGPIAATIQSDCAPWDGPAFRVTIPAASFGAGYDSATISVSIWKAPKIPASTTFDLSVSYSSGEHPGAAMLSLKPGQSERLNGSVTFESVTDSAPVRGSVDLATKTGTHFKASFIAAWNHVRMLCG